MNKRRKRGRSQQRSTDNLTHDHSENIREPFHEPKVIEKIFLWVLWWVCRWGLPITAWAVICGGTALVVSAYTYWLIAILIGLLVGTVIIGLMVEMFGSAEIELGCFSVILLILTLILLPPFKQSRQRALQRQRQHTQQEMKQHRSQRAVAPIFLMAQHRLEFL
jgi:hypothetical protein